MEHWSFVICDVFSERPLAGNQLAVFTAAEPIPEALLQPLAREINFSESVFVYPAAADGDARIRIFMPELELPFAGHPVVGTALVLAAGNDRPEIRLETGIGTVPVRIERKNGNPSFAWMTQLVPTVTVLPDPEPLLAALGVSASELPVTAYDNGVRHCYVKLADEAAVAALDPDMRALAQATRGAHGRVGGVNCFAGAGTRWKTRMFAPGDGIPEDPATGSAAGPLACHLLRHGLIAGGDLVQIAQGAELGRPSTLFAKITGTPDQIERVEVGGAAVTVAHGHFDAERLTTHLNAG